MSQAECCACGRAIDERHWFCELCERAYNLPRSLAEWPAWAKYLKADEAKRRRRARHEVQVIPVSLLTRAERMGVDRLFYGEPNDD